ncbi:MAG: RNA polymerase sigma factor [Candidatus Acidiferrales bacterium]
MEKTDTPREALALDEVVRRAQAGDEAAVAALYHQFRPRVFGLCRYLLGAREDAEDAASEVFIKAQRAMNTYDNALPFERWLLSIASHQCLDVLRRRRTERRLFDTASLDTYEPPLPGPTALGALLTAEEAERVRRAIAGLPDHYRLPLTLRYYSELSYDQIAGSLGLSRSHVATLIYRAKKELRRRLASREVTL